MAATLPRGVCCLITGVTVTIPPVVLNNPNVKGIVIGESWCTAEATQGNYDWTVTEALLAQVPSNWFIRFGIQASGLRCSQGDNVPDWAADLIPSNEWISYIDKNRYHSTYNQVVTIPVPWGATWLTLKQNLFLAAGAQFSGDSRIKVVELPIFTGTNNDWSVPSGTVVDGVPPTGSTMNSRMLAAGYTHAAMVAAGAAMFSVASAWPDQVFVMPTGPIARPLESDPISVAREVRDAARAIWGSNRVIIANYGVSNRMPLAPPPITTDWQVLYESRPYTAGQALWNVSGDTTYRMNGGVPGFPVAIMEPTIDKFVSYGGRGYFEIYLRDIIDPVMAEAIAYADALLTSESPVPPNPPNPPSPPSPPRRNERKMRTINFRDGVLHPVAYKLGLDPDQANFLTNQAIPLGTYIEEWVRRTYDGRDWPEWTVTHQFAPDTDHIVTWDAIAIDLVIPPHLTGTPVQLGRVLKVFLVDPATTDAPVDTPFTLTDSGIHCGYEHGGYVWIRYLPPAPKFTAVQWKAPSSYQVGDVVYSYTTGECYKSKVNNNVGHDPAVEGDLNPPPPQIEMTQPWAPDNPGTAERAETMVVHMDRFTDASLVVPPDPPPSGAVYKITIWDGTTVFGDSFVTADGVMTLDDIIDTSVTQLIADLPGTYVVTGSHADKTITISDNSYFTTTGATYRDVDNTERWFLVDVEAYIPPQGAVEGMTQVTRITLSTGTTFPGALYTMTITDSVGGDHTVEYQSAITDSAVQILQGLITAAEASTDAYWDAVQFLLDVNNLTLDVSIKNNASVDVVTTVIGSAYWDLEPFPKAIADAVIRGAYADFLKEWGQTDKGAAEEQAVPSEVATSEGDFETTPNPQLTGQQRALSRYQV